MSYKSATSEQIISLPKGGGMMHGIAEKFSSDLHTGIGNFTAATALPSGHNGFQPQLNLVCSTGNGNDPFGVGWNLISPAIHHHVTGRSCSGCGASQKKTASCGVFHWKTHTWASGEGFRICAVCMPFWMGKPGALQVVKCAGRSRETR